MLFLIFINFNYEKKKSNFIFLKRRSLVHNENILTLKLPNYSNN